MPQKEYDQEIKWGQRTLMAAIHLERLLKTAGFSGCPKNSCTSTSVPWRKAVLETKRKRKAEINAWSPVDLPMQQHQRKPVGLRYGYIIYCSRSSAIIILRMEKKKPELHIFCEQRDKSFLHLDDNLHWLPAMLKFLLDASHLKLLLNNVSWGPILLSKYIFPTAFPNVQSLIEGLQVTAFW